jgi:cytoskeleton protein RodZ
MTMPETTLQESGGQTAGHRLRQARKEQGLTLEEGARVTRVSRAYLAALEEDRYEKLPSEAYARGFLRIYARYLGFGEKDIESLFENLFPDVSPAGPSEEEVEVPPAKTGRLPRLAGFTAWKWIVPALLAVAAATLMFRAGREPQIERNVPLEKAAGMQSYSSAAVPVQETVSSHIPSQPPGAQEHKSEEPFDTDASHEKGAVLKLKALEDGALDVAIDDMGSQHYELKAGDLFEWKGEKVFSLDLENAGGVEVELNGRILEPLGERGESAHVILKAYGASAGGAP